MRLRAIWAAVAALACLVSASLCAADTMWDYQAVDSTGYGIHPKVWADETDPANRIVVEGVALAGSDEILDPSQQYTVFLQDDASDRGGMQAWSGKFLYGDSMWAALRTSDYIDFQAGDRLRLTGLLADMGRGKVVMNNRGHSGSPLLVWHVDRIGHSGLPDPELIPSVANCNYFDQTRVDGGERYQTRYVMLHGVHIAAGVWGNNGLMTIADASGTVGMLLSARGDFGAHPQPAGKLNVVGIFDQEDDTVSPYTDGYRVWVKRSADIAVALDGCREVAQRASGERVALVNKVVSRVYDGCFYVQDRDRTGGVRVTSDRMFKPGDVLCVQGVVTSVNGENAILPTYISRSVSVPRPMFVTSPALWGEQGLNVNGILVRVSARVGSDQGDGTHSLTDDSGRTIYVRTNGVVMPAQNTNVTITAVATSANGVPLLLLADGHDIQVVSQ